LRLEKPPYLTAEQAVSVSASGLAAPIEVGMLDEFDSVEVKEQVARERPAPGGTQLAREEVAVVPGSRGDTL
jgi:hypothetical protein